MSLDTFLTMTPLTPYVHTYDATNPGAPYGVGWLSFFGTYIGYGGSNSLETLHEANEVLLGGNPVPLSNKAIVDVRADIFRRSAMQLTFRGINVSTNNQYLLIFHLKGEVMPTAQFFVGTELAREEQIHLQQQVALLMDVPDDNIYVCIYIRIASNNPSEMMRFKGVDIFLL